MNKKKITIRRTIKQDSAQDLVYVQELCREGIRTYHYDVLCYNSAR